MFNFVNPESYHPGYFNLNQANRKIESLGIDKVDTAFKKIDKEFLIIKKCRQTQPSKKPPSFLGLRKDYRQMLDQKEGVYWNTIKAIKTPILQEQLIDLHLLCQSKEIKNQQELFDFAILTAQTNATNPCYEIGLILFGCNHCPEFISNLAKSRNPDFIKQLESKFDQELERVFDKLNQHYLSHSKIGLQSPSAALKTQIPIEIARLLMIDTGSVNFGIIPLIACAFIENPKSPHNHEINLVYTLKMLRVSPDLREKMTHISHPCSPKAPAYQVIRATLDLPVHVKLTPLHAQLTALSGLLSHLRQGADGSCFATPLAIWLLSSRLSHCLDDFASLLKSSKLTRKTKKATRDFPFLLRLSNKTTKTKFQINRKGEIFENKKLLGHISDVPGFQKACEALSLTPLKDSFDEVVKDLFKDENNETKTTRVKEILKVIANEAKTLSIHEGHTFGKLLTTAFFSFEGQVNHPLLGVWENAIAGMAESEESGMITSAILSSTISVFNDAVDNLAKSDHCTQIKERFSSELLKRIHLHYDPTIPHQSIGSDQHTTQSAFVLFEKKPSSKRTKLIRIDNPHSFQEFLLRILHSCREDSTPPDLIHSLEGLLSKDQFIINILNRYDPANNHVLDPITNYKVLKHTPWVTKSGNNFSKVIQTYFEEKEGRKTHLIKPKDSKNLMVQLISYFRKRQEFERENHIKYPNCLIPVRIPGIHAFSLTFGNKHFKTDWTKKRDVNAWIENELILPGQQVGETPISNTLKKTLIEYCQKNLVLKDKTDYFLKKANQPKEGISIKSFRDWLLILINEIDKVNDNSSKRGLLDTFLFNNLPEQQRKKLEDLAIHFADTNWCKGLYDVHLCFTVNPGSGQLEVWGVQDNGTNLFALNQKTWLNEWEIFTI